MVQGSKSGPNFDNCVEVAYVTGAVGVRDSKDKTGPALVFAPGDWHAFVARTPGSTAVRPALIDATRR